jgi:UDP-N-acetylmuramate--alanine ligase
VTKVYAAREEPVPGVEGSLVAQALAAERPGMAVAWTPELEDAVRFVVRRARRGDLVLTIGAGDVECAGELLLEELG